MGLTLFLGSLWAKGLSAFGKTGRRRRPILKL